MTERQFRAQMLCDMAAGQWNSSSKGTPLTTLSGEEML
ncbi:hypothetical protein DFQ01_103369 [Paenibacillus cellulosilyticus]|uniref:Uncharacterized protein n=1 Tax=Paenibacillus cellulosilyticus TaxID=375489 RepID=A0A2V2YYG2_9BACL|nr:hypothetical protein DFQ01_103369 [Paenibacillus cellulosilyticus]